MVDLSPILFGILVSELSNEEYTRLNHNVHVTTQFYDHSQHIHSHVSTPIPPMCSTLPTNGNMTSYISLPDSQYIQITIYLYVI